MKQREGLLTQVTQIAVLAIVGTVVLFDMVRDGDPWWLAAGLVVALGILLNRSTGLRPPLYLALHAVLVSALMLLHPNFVIFGFTFSSNATRLLPNRTGVLWIAGMALLTGGAFVRHSGWTVGLLTTLAITCGYVSLALFSYGRTQTERARRKSEALLEELRAAHDRLQAYAAQVEELAVAEERNRLAREMHDTLGHRLTVASVQLEGAQRLVADDPDRAARMIDTVREQVQEALGQLRRTVATLRTPLEADLPLPQALARLAGGFREATGVAVQLALPEGVPALPAPHRIALYRAAQEALTNVQRHADAGQVWIELALAGAQVALTVGDDGAGLPDGAEDAGFGLRGMRERAAQLGGTLVLGSRSGGGAQVVVRLPLPAEDGDG